MEKIFLELIARGLMEKIKTGDFPNIPFPTLGGHVVWNNIVSSNGWKLQRNSITGHYRILDSKDIRRAWGTKETMLNIMNDISKG